MAFLSDSILCLVTGNPLLSQIKFLWSISGSSSVSPANPWANCEGSLSTGKAGVCFFLFFKVDKWYQDFILPRVLELTCHISQNTESTDQYKKNRQLYHTETSLLRTPCLFLFKSSLMSLNKAVNSSPVKLLHSRLYQTWFTQESRDHIGISNTKGICAFKQLTRLGGAQRKWATSNRQCPLCAAAESEQASLPPTAEQKMLLGQPPLCSPATLPLSEPTHPHCGQGKKGSLTFHLTNVTGMHLRG